MTVQEVYTLMLSIINQNINGDLSPANFNSFINIAQKSYVSFLLGSFQTYTPGRPIARVELGNNGVIRERLSPFIGKAIDITLDVDGVYAYPEDYCATDAMYFGGSMQRVKSIGQDRLASHLGSVIDPIAENPVYLFLDVGYQIFPATLTNVKLSYIRQPRDIVYAYTGNGVYDPVNSVDPLWNDIDMMEIISRALAQTGVRLQSANIQQYAQTIKQGGQ